MYRKDILFLTLKTFSATGGIEKLNRIIGKALEDICNKDSRSFNMFSMYDRSSQLDNRYFSEPVFKGFNGRKLSFTFQAAVKGRSSNVVLLSHINLLPVGYLIKLISPKTHLALFAHGIEVWKPVSKLKSKMLQHVDKVICVSRYTRDKMISVHKLKQDQTEVLNNCLDPFLDDKAENKDVTELRSKYGINNTHQVLLTLSRLSAHDRDKGYEKVLTAIKDLSLEFPLLVYIIGGKYDAAEKKWLDELISAKELGGKVIFTDYIPEDKIAAHFALCDVYIMPSSKEGFGIVFIEAMHYGLPVIAGNVDGSVDALADGAFGLLVDPANQQEINNALRKVLINKSSFIPEHTKVEGRFGYSAYKQKIEKVLERMTNNVVDE